MNKITPTLLSSLLCCILLYTGLVKPFDHRFFYSLIPKEKITFLQGKIISNPVKSNSGKTYSVSFSPEFAGTRDLKSSKIHSYYSVKGEVSLYIPSEIVEAYYPGKLYSLALKKTGQNMLQEG